MQKKLDFSDHAAAAALWDEAFQHPRKKYVVQPQDAEVALRWLRDNAYRTNFGWPKESGLAHRIAELGPMRKGEIIPLDTLYERNACGWVDFSDEADYDCTAPIAPEDAPHVETNERGGRRCFGFQCPIAYETSREDIRLRFHDLFVSDFKDNQDEPQGWLVLHKRPRYAYVPNITVLGCEGWEKNT